MLITLIMAAKTTTLHCSDRFNTNLIYSMHVTSVHLHIRNGSYTIPKLTFKIKFRKQMIVILFMLTSLATHGDHVATSCPQIITWRSSPICL